MKKDYRLEAADRYITRASYITIEIDNDSNNILYFIDIACSFLNAYKNSEPDEEGIEFCSILEDEIFLLRSYAEGRI